MKMLKQHNYLYLYFFSFIGIIGILLEFPGSTLKFEEENELL